jgi:membrane protein DedA with SNARE-associated domain
VDRVLLLIEHYGYLLILFGVMLESMGVPLPGETLLIAAGVLVQQGHLDLGYAIAFGILGAVLGDQFHCDERGFHLRGDEPPNGQEIGSLMMARS